MKADELRGRDPEDLRRELLTRRRELFDLRFQWQAEENPDTNRRRNLRRNIARLTTVLQETENARTGAQ